jgi:hypothetical protein
MTHSSPHDRLDAIFSMTSSSLGQLDVDDLLAALLKGVGDVLESDTAAVLLLDRTGLQLIARAAWGIEEEIRQGVRVPFGRGFAGTIAASRQPLMLDRVDATTVENPLLWERGIKRMLGVPLLSGSHLLGVLHVGRVVDRPFRTADVHLLEVIADRIAGEIQAREFEVQRAAARVLQRSLLPSALPSVEGVEFATRYVPAELGGVGGDWYDAFVLPASKELWVIVGDVAGHGLEAAVIMGRLRSALRSYALLNDGPERAIALAHEKLRFFEPGHMATLLCGVLRPPYDAIHLTSAGHLPPVLAIPDGRPRVIDVPVVPPLGVVEHLEPKSIDIELPDGSVLLAFTDGLIERPVEALNEGLDRVVAAASAKAPEVVCREVMDAVIGRSVPADDIALLTMRVSRSAP